LPDAALALADLPTLTGGQFSAAAVGSYEREFRWPTVERLALLCSCYGVSLVDVLSGHPAPTGHRGAVMAAVDEAATAQETRALRRLAASVTCRRTGPTRQVVATGLPRLRHGDLDALAVVLDTQRGCDDWPLEASRQGRRTPPPRPRTRLKTAPDL